MTDHMGDIGERELLFSDTLYRLNVPYSGSLELTHRCNLSCRHCYQFPPRGPEMETSEWEELLEQLAEAGCLFVSLTGGEPLLREDLPELLSRAAELDFVVTVQTNATLLDKKAVRFMGGIPNLRVDVSLYGAAPSTHDYLTGVEGSFEATRRALDMLLSEGVPVLLKVTVGNFNVREVRDIATLARELGLEAIFSAMIFPRNDGDPAPTAFRLNDRELEEFTRFQVEYSLPLVAELMGMEGKVEEKELLRYLTSCAIGPPDPSGGRKHRCGCARIVFAVNPYGDVYPCVALPVVVGNVREERFADIWRDSPALRELREEEEELPEECAACELLDTCPICRALCYLEDGAIKGRNAERCRHTHAIARVWEDGRAED